MKCVLRTILVCLMVVVFAPAAVAAGAKAAPKAKSAAKPAIVMMAPDDLKWAPVPTNPDVMIAVVWGDPAKGPHAAFHKFKPGWSAGVHTHSADIKIAVVSGTLIGGPEGGPEKKLPAGSFEYQPHGVKHVTKCDMGSECIIFAVASGKFDIIPAEAPKK